MMNIGPVDNRPYFMFARRCGDFIGWKFRIQFAAGVIYEE